MQSRDEDFSVVPFQLLLLVGLCLETLQSFVHMTKDIELQAGSVSASNGTPGFNISPCYLWGIQSFPLSLLPHRAWATAKLSWTCPNTKELSRFKTESQPKKPTLWPTPPLTSYSPAIRVNCKHIVPTAWLIEKNSSYLGAWFFPSCLFSRQCNKLLLYMLALQTTKASWVPAQGHAVSQHDLK